MVQVTRIFLIFLALGTSFSCAQVPRKSGIFERYAVASANPAATEAGITILRQGGTAIDAAVAVETTLGLVEPQSSGLGGGAFLIYYDAQKKSLSTYDGREIAPAATRPDQFLQANGTPMSRMDQVIGGKSVGVPGAIPMLALAHSEHGRLAWKDLFDPAIGLAESGFTVGPRMHRLIGETPTLRDQEATRKYFYDANGEPLAVGTHVHNHAYAETLRALARNPRALNDGPIAAEIAATISNAPKNPQTMTTGDLASYRPKERTAVCATYHIYKICGVGPPASGATTVLATLGMLERFDLHALGPKSAESWHLIAEAERLAYADRGKYLGDPDFVSVPTRGLIDHAYLQKRSLLIDPERAAPGPREAGTPPMAQQTGALDHSYEIPSTSHFVIVDRYGDVVSMTATVENTFGSELMVDGFILNNQLTDFSPVSPALAKSTPNAAVPGKRPMSSMSPLIVFDDTGRVVMAIGSPGGKRIIGYVVKAIIAALDWNMPMQQAIDMPNVLNLNGATEIEAGPGVDALAGALRAKGHDVKVMQGEESGLQGFRIVGNDFDAAADRRREGTVDGGQAWWPWRWIKQLFD